MLIIIYIGTSGWRGNETGFFKQDTICVYADSGTDPGHYIILLESDREIMPENGTFIQRS